MRLKIVTGILLLAGICLSLCWPWVIHQRPIGIKRFAHDYGSNAFAIMFVGYLGTVLFIFICTACLSMLMFYYAREEYREQRMDNMKGLIEGSLQDIKMKP